MSLNHLSRQEIDSYVSGSQDEAFEDRVEQHLKACERCREEVAEYSLILTELNNIKVYEPTNNFSKAVINRLPDCYQQSEKPALEFFSIAAVLLLMVSALFFFLDDSTSLFASITGIISTLILSVQNIVNRVQAYQNMDVLVLFILYAGTFKMLDLLFGKRRVKKRLHHPG